jgi:hypothetical protein
MRPRSPRPWTGWPMLSRSFRTMMSEALRSRNAEVGADAYGSAKDPTKHQNGQAISRKSGGALLRVY